MGNIFEAPLAKPKKRKKKKRRIRNQKSMRTLIKINDQRHEKSVLPKTIKTGI